MVAGLGLSLVAMISNHFSSSSRAVSDGTACAKHFTKAGPLLAEVAADLNSPIRNGHGLPNEKRTMEEKQTSQWTGEWR